MKALIIIILSTVSMSLYSQIFNSDTLTTIAYWKQGESYKYQRDKYRYKQKNEEVTETNSTSFITFYIQEETDSSYLIKYQIDSINIKGKFEDNPIVNTLTSVISNKLIYLIETDENGSFIEIRNWEEIKVNIIHLMSQMTRFNGIDEEQQNQMDHLIKEMTDSKEKIQSMCQREFAVLFSNYGYVFDTRDTIEYEQQLPNPFGGNPFPSSGKIFFDLASVDSTNAITLYDISSIDEVEGKKAIIQALKQIAPNLEELENEMNNVEFKIMDSMTQEYSLDNGSILNATLERKVVSNDLKEKAIQIDRQQWKLLKIE